MVKAKYTPGPWKWRDYGSSLEGKDRAFVLWFGGNGECGGLDYDQEGQANSYLIAAAPDLLEALETSLAFVAAWAGVYQHNNALPDFHPEHAKAIKQIKDAIAKALGETNED